MNIVEKFYNLLWHLFEVRYLFKLHDMSYWYNQIHSKFYLYFRYIYLLFVTYLL